MFCIKYKKYEIILLLIKFFVNVLIQMIQKINILKSVITPVYTKNNVFLRKTRSFVRRQRKLTKSQLIIAEKLWPMFCLDFKSHVLNVDTLFNKKKPIIVEIGFGSGDSLVQIASDNPNLNFLGVEVYLSGIVSCLKLIKNLNLKNLKLIYHDAVEVINHMFANNKIFKIQAFFPDPWYKKKHHKRRIFTKSFIKLINRKLVNNGILHIVTDCESYANNIVQTVAYLKKNNNLRLKKEKLINKSFLRTITKYEKRGIILGNSIFDLIFRKIIN